MFEFISFTRKFRLGRIGTMVCHLKTPVGTIALICDVVYTHDYMWIRLPTSWEFKDKIHLFRVQFVERDHSDAFQKAAKEWLLKNYANEIYPITQKERDDLRAKPPEVKPVPKARAASKFADKKKAR